MLIDVSNLRVSYGRLEALRGVSLTVDDGELVAIVGSNGAGKSTLLMAISGLRATRAERIEFKGRDMTNLKPHDRVRAGLVQVPEGRRLFPSLSVYENLGLGAHTVHPQSDFDERCSRVFDLFPRLRSMTDRKAGVLSGGEQQMLAIGRGLMADPKLIMFDEPSLGLAPQMVDQMFEAILDIRRSGVGILLVEQNASRALELADRAYVLEVGSVADTGTGDEMLKSPRVKEAYLGVG